MTGFDPDDLGEGGLFGLPHALDEAAVRVLAVPWEGTVSYGRGTSRGPEMVAEASLQVDLHHPEYGDRVWQAGLALEPPSPELAGILEDGRRAGRDPARVNPISAALDGFVERWTERTLRGGQVPAILGGEHSVALGGLLAAARARPGLGVLHVDAHADLRAGFEGFERSHASVMHNALERSRELGTIVQVAIRDLGRAEAARIRSDSRVQAFFDLDLAERMLRGAAWSDLVQEIVSALPPVVWISFDVDGLDPALCPGTGTPVPGGLGWAEACYLLRALGRSGRRVVGFDLCEVGAAPWDANVGARLLYELAAVAATGGRAGC